MKTRLVRFLEISIGCNLLYCCDLQYRFFNGSPKTEGLNEPLKRHVSFNCEFFFENSRDVRVRKKRTDATFSKIDIFRNAAFIGSFFLSKRYLNFTVVP